MKSVKNRNFASILIFISAGLGLLNFYFAKDLLNSAANLAIAVFTILFIIGLGFLARKDIRWVKWVFLLIMLIGLLSLPQILNYLVIRPIVGIVNLLQNILQVGALILLFLKDKTNETE